MTDVQLLLNDKSILRLLSPETSWHLAIYDHARKINRALPADNPVNAIGWNGEERRGSAMRVGDLKSRFIELAAINNPIRQEFHLFTQLSACRSAALKEAKPDAGGMKSDA